MEYNASYNLKTTCRICLHEKSDLISIFQNDNTCFRIDDLILYCSNIRFAFENSTPNNICNDCLKELDISVKFKKKCMHSEQVLKQCFKTEINDINIKLELDVSDHHNFESPSLHNIGNDNHSETCKTKIDNHNIESNKMSEKTMNELICKNNETNKKISNCDKTINIKNKNHSKKCKMHISKQSNGSEKELLSKREVTSHKNGNQYKRTTKSNVKVKRKNVNDFKCETCNLQCQNKWVLKVHMRTHSGEKPFQCDLCKKRFVSNSNMRMHKRLTHNEDKQKRFTTKSYLKEHIARHQGDKRFFCEICASKFISDVNLKQHMLVHGIQNRNFKRHQCTFCDYKTMGKVDLARHIRKHTGEKPFRCPEEGCQSAFAGKASLKLHIRIHTGEKPYTCSECPARFSRGDKYKNHMLKKHNITNVGPNKRSKLIVKELAEAIENGQTTTIPMDILKIST
ncbi:uncharacterized protein LOC143919793 isoform X2 [Arctopsyche grandis]|uniref:uncharacterized protein LOC143919793 isoform X2 n=1 Tax=Arctopsyche grandis TaxID=121162 RepID=UPI00406D7425